MALKQTKVGDIVKPDDASTTTQVETETFCFTWEIANFRDLKNDLASPVFKGGPKGQIQWKLHIHPFGQQKSNGNSTRLQEENQDEDVHVGVFLHLHKSGEKNDVNAEWRISLLDSHRKILAKIQSDAKIFNSASRTWGWDKWILRSLILNPAYDVLSEGHKLRVNCEVLTFLGVKHQPVFTTSGVLNESAENGDSELETKMMEFLSLGKFSDVTLKTETESFPCIKFILASHSPVFEAMFDSGMLESTENTVKIVDFPAHIVQAMVQFLYTGKTEMLEENAGELLSISDKYQIKRLKGKCVKTLMKNLNFENAAETLILAHFHSPQILKPQVISFINRMKKQVQNTDGYKSMVKAHPIICAELYASQE